MKNLITILTLFILMAISAHATLAPVRISVATTPNAGANLTIDVLTSAGATKGISIDKGSVVTDAAGALSFVISEAAWTGAAYNANDLVRVTYGGVVLKIERMQVICSKQGLFGTYITENELNGEGTAKTGYYLKSNGTTGNWVAPDAVAEFTTTRVDVSTIPGGVNPINLSSYGNYNLVVLYNDAGGDVTIDPSDPTKWPSGAGINEGHILILANRMTSSRLIKFSASYTTIDASRDAKYRTAILFMYAGPTLGWVNISGNH